MIKPGEIQKTASRLGRRDTQIEKDYVIGWVLKGIAQNDYLKAKLIFKGGTALRKIYFPNYRLSEDLDFTFNGDNYKIEEIKKQFELNPQPLLLPREGEKGDEFFILMRFN